MHADTEILRFISNLVHSDTRQKLKILLALSHKKKIKQIINILFSF